MRIKYKKDIVERFRQNPILTKQDIPLPCNTVFNCAAIKFKGKYIVLLRIEGLEGKSFFMKATSKDGYYFEIDEKPCMVPCNEEPYKTFEANGIEDPRITLIGDTYYIMYVASSKFHSRLALVKTKDFEDFERVAIISEPGNKDGIIFPEKFDGNYVRLDRPPVGGGNSIWISYSPDLIYWGNAKPVMTTRPGYWDSARIGSGTQPIKTEKGWLEIYHGVRKTPAGDIYRLGCALFDLKDPSKLIGRSLAPILSPSEQYERTGDVPNVVFTCGAVYEKAEGEVKIYYGASDTVICIGVAKIEDLLINCME